MRDRVTKKWGPFRFEYAPQDEWNSSDFSLDCGPFRVWSCMSPRLGFDCEIEPWQARATLKLPYLLVGFRVGREDQRFWRKGHGIPEDEMVVEGVAAPGEEALREAHRALSGVPVPEGFGTAITGDEFLRRIAEGYNDGRD